MDAPSSSVGNTLVFLSVPLTSGCGVLLQAMPPTSGAGSEACCWMWGGMGLEHDLREEVAMEGGRES